MPEHGSKFLQAASAGRADAGDGHLHELSNLFITWIGCLEIEEFKQATTAVGKLAHRVPDILLFLSFDLNMFDVHGRVRGFFEIFLTA